MPRIDVTQAVAIARAFLDEAFGKGQAREVRLEEVDLPDESPPAWHITLSFVRPPSSDWEQFSAALNKGQLPREYKVLTILCDGGEVRSMKIRQL
jgi:hypothetical protein